METSACRDPINGNEAGIDPTTPRGALALFYRAFNTRSLDLMRESWATAPDIAMDNPLGGIMRGWEEIERVYRKLFSGPARVYVEFFDYTLHVGADLCYAVGRERGSALLGEKRLELAIRTSRVFRQQDGLWRQVHHHGSMEDADLLAAYQSGVAALAKGTAIHPTT